MGRYFDLDVTLGYQSREALKRVNNATNLGMYMKFFLGTGGSFDAIFSSNAAEKAFTITQVDFMKIAKAIQAVDKIQCRVIKNIALERINQTHSNERKFWERINDSCSTQ